jgi:hypothetical protein
MATRDSVLQEMVDLLGATSPPDLSQTTACWSFPESGIEIMLRVDMGSQEATVSAVHLFAEGYEGHHEYPGELLQSIRFGNDRRSIAERLGNPTESDGGQYSPELKKVVPPWDRFQFDDCSIRFQFNDAKRLELVSLLPR